MSRKRLNVAEITNFETSVKNIKKTYQSVKLKGPLVIHAGLYLVRDLFLTYYHLQVPAIGCCILWMVLLILKQVFYFL